MLLMADGVCCCWADSLLMLLGAALDVVSSLLLLLLSVLSTADHMNACMLNMYVRNTAVGYCC
jgi:hypothetical protein